jgi:dihydrofolate synthase/folylpolyglutamate synthase
VNAFTEVADRPVLGDRIDDIVARLHLLYPQLIDLSLDRLRRLLTKLGHPECQLPPVIHVAGTNGKGSTCAFLRAMAEAAGLSVHVYTSPHLVRFNERIRIAGDLVSDEVLADALETLERVNDGAPITVFEMITATALHLFAETPADLCVVEVGLGGRADATNVIDRPAACAITSISIDHCEFLGDTLAAIAGEKAGIMKPGVPVVVGAQTEAALAVLTEAADRAGAKLLLRDRDWHLRPAWRGFRFTDRDSALVLPTPSLPGAHQLDNAGIAVAALRASGVGVSDAAIATGIASATWPARLQRLDGRLAALLPPGWELWLDGGHNPGAGAALGEHVAGWTDRPTHVVVGMKRAKDTTAFLHPLLARAASVWAVAEPGQHLALSVEAIVAASGGVARPGPRVVDALSAIVGEDARPARVLICGSLYLAGEVLKLDA